MKVFKCLSKASEPNNRVMAFLQAQAEGLCLRYPENLGLHPSLSYEAVVNMLLRAITLSQQVPYTWGFIDKPPEGQLFLLFLTVLAAFPSDGIRYQEPESRYVIPVGSNRELEVCEVKFGFIPNSQDTAAWRGRRRYRLHKGGHPQLVLVHYFRGHYTSIPPNIANQPVRSYPLRQVNEPAIYVVGDKMGQKVYTHGGPMQGTGIPQGHVPQQPGMHPNVAAGAMPPLPMNMHTQQAMLAQQNSNMEALERRRERERVRDRAVNMAGRAQPPRVEDDDSADEADHISTRVLTLTRYKRNHELMNEVFRYAAFGDKNKENTDQLPYSIFKHTELEEKVAKLTTEIDEIKQRASERTKARHVADVGPSESQVPINAMMDVVLAEGVPV